MSQEEMIGKVCVCSVGRVGVITDHKELEWGKTFVGMGLDGKGLWASSSPIVIADSLKEYTERLLKKESQILYFESGVMMRCDKLMKSMSGCQSSEPNPAS